MEVGPGGCVIGYGVLGRSKARISVLLGGAVGLGLCLLLLQPSVALAASFTDDTSLNDHPLRPADEHRSAAPL